MKINKYWKKNLESNIVTEKMLSEVIYSYNARGISNRKQAEKWSNFDPDIEYQFEKDSKYYFSLKNNLLRFATPCKMHTIEYKWRSPSHPDIVTDYWYYLFYELGNFTFHRYTKNPSDYNLPIVQIDSLESFENPREYPLSEKTCDKIYEGLCDGSLKYVNEVEH